MFSRSRYMAGWNDRGTRERDRSRRSFKLTAMDKARFVRRALQRAARWLRSIRASEPPPRHIAPAVAATYHDEH